MKAVKKGEGLVEDLCANLDDETISTLLAVEGLLKSKALLYKETHRTSQLVLQVQHTGLGCFRHGWSKLTTANLCLDPCLLHPDRRCRMVRKNVIASIDRQFLVLEVRELKTGERRTRSSLFMIFQAC